MDRIIGLPAIVSTRDRIVIDKSLRNLFDIPKDGPVKMIVNKSCLQIFPYSATVPNATLKSISIGRFNLPVQWAYINKIEPGDRVFLIAADDCILVYPKI